MCRSSSVARTIFSGSSGPREVLARRRAYRLSRHRGAARGDAGRGAEPARRVPLVRARCAAALLAGRIEARRKAGNPYSQTCVDLISDYLTGTEEVVKGVRKHVTATMGL
jgi:hypothetical protein